MSETQHTGTPWKIIPHPDGYSTCLSLIGEADLEGDPLPDPDTPDSAHDTLPTIRAALSTARPAASAQEPRS